MTQTAIPLTRYKVIGIAILMVLLVLSGRLCQLQVLGWAKYAKIAASTRLASVWEAAPRGTIYDRNGRVLADNRSSWNVSIRPADFPKDQGKAENEIQQLAAILGRTTAEVRDAVKTVISSNAKVESGPLEKIGADVPLKVVAQVQERAYELPGVEIEQVMQRYYAGESLACHVLGYARIISDDELQQVKNITVPPELSSSDDPSTNLVKEKVYSPNTMFGKSGIEKVCELDTVASSPFPVLQGIRGRTRYEVTAGGESAGPPVDVRPPVPGASVYLTLDAHLQAVAEQSLNQAIRATSESAGAAVLLDCNTGEVLALASQPGYNLNNWVRGFKREEYQAMMDNPRAPLLDHAINGLYAPGSTFKMISSCAVLSTTRLTTATTYDCPGYIYAGRQRYRCWKSAGHGPMSFFSGFSQSCDVYFYDLVRYAHLSDAAIADFSTRFGLGSPTGIELPGEAGGLVPSAKWKERVHGERWTLGNTLNMVIGQGELQVTPLQMAVVTAAFANGGKLVSPYLIKSIKWPHRTGGQLQTPKHKAPKAVDVDPTVIQEVRTGMRLVCSDPRGTGAGLFRDFGVPVAGKTGSAQHVPGKPTHAWFVAFAPYDKPKYACAVLISQGGHGGSAAGPVARDILAAAFGLQNMGPSAAGQGD